MRERAENRFRPRSRQPRRCLPGPPRRAGCIVGEQWRRATITVRSPITSTASAFTIAAAWRRRTRAICCVGWSIVTGAAPRRNGRHGRRRLMPIVRPTASKARPGACPMSGTRAGSSRPAGLNILIDPVWSQRASPFRFVGPKRVNDPGIAFDAICRRSTSCWCRTAHYDHLDVDDACRGLPPRTARAWSRRSATTPSCAITIRPSRPRPTTGTIALSSARASP